MNSSEEPRTRIWLCLALILIVGIVLRTQTFTDLWVGMHNAWGGAFYGNAARNFLRYGYVATNFAPVVNSGIVDPSQFEMYYHHPPLSYWLTSISYRVFGVHEWSARLFPLIFSLLTMAVVFAIARAALGLAIALCSVLFLAVLPIDAYYATHTDTNGSMSIFFTVLALEGYRRWLLSGGGRDFALCVASIVLGCLTGWYTYLIVPGIVAHGWLVHPPVPGRAIRTAVWRLPVVTVIVFALFLILRQIALAGGRPEAFESLADKVVKRSLGSELDRIAVMGIYLKQIWDLYTIPFIVLMMAWVVFFVRDLLARRLRTIDWCIAILLSYGVLYAIAFTGHLKFHDFFARTYAPGVALASAVALFRLADTLRQRGARNVVLGVAVAGICAVAILRTRSLYASDDHANARLLRGFGDAVGVITTPRDPVFLPIKDDRVLQYYVDRPVTFELNTIEKLEAATATISGHYLVLLPERNAGSFQEIRTYLQGKYVERLDRGLYIYTPRPR